MSAVAGLRGTGDWGTDERPKNFREMILRRNPNGTAPIFALMARVQKESTDDAEFKWWDEPNDLVRLQVNGALGSGDTTVIVDSADPTAANPGRVWGLAQHLKAGDLLLVEPASDAATYDHEIIEVVTVISNTEFTVTRGVAGTSAAAIGNDLYLSKIGSRYAEGTGAPQATSRQPIQYSNYCQIFKDSYELTATAAGTRLRTGDPLKNEKKRKSHDHARDIEMAILFGKKNETTGANGKPLRTMDGIRNVLPAATTSILTGGWTMSTLLDNVSPIFDFDTEAGDTRIAFCGNGALNAINKKIGASSGFTGARIQFGGEKSVYGVNFTELVFPQGRLLLKTHPLMNRHGLYTNSMFALDFSALRWRPFRGRDTSFKDNIQAKDEDLVRGQWLTEAGLEVRYGGLTCGYVGGFDQ